MATPGFGKRSAPGQNPHTGTDFAHLPFREAYIAAFIDRLPDGAAIDTKTLAAEQPLYGQQAVRSALNALTTAGHLRRIRLNGSTGTVRWVQRTFFSRTARSEAWWLAFLSEQDDEDREPPGFATVNPVITPTPGVHPYEAPRPRQAPDRTAHAPQPARPTHAPQLPKPPQAPRQPRQAQAVLTRITRAARSDAYEALAGLGRADSRMTLSASECAELEELAGQWLAHGATIQHFTTALTAGLPQTVHCPGALARKRLVAKMPPAPLLGLWEAEGPRRERILECADCGRPGRPETMPQGSCRDCREGRANPGSPHPDREGIRVRVEQLRAAMQRGRGTFGEDRSIPPFGE